MSSILTGKHIQVSVFGQSHSKAIGAVIDGLPAGVKIDSEKVAAFMRRRAPGNTKYSTKRREADEPVVLSGLVDGVTCGAPLGFLIENTNTRSSDYDNLRAVPRPGHADYPANVRYGVVIFPAGLPRRFALRVPFVCKF
jgi:chorismate synthase